MASDLALVAAGAAGTLVVAVITNFQASRTAAKARAHGDAVRREEHAKVERSRWIDERRAMYAEFMRYGEVLTSVASQQKEKMDARPQFQRIAADLAFAAPDEVEEAVRVATRAVGSLRLAELAQIRDGGQPDLDALAELRREANGRLLDFRRAARGDLGISNGQPHE